MNKLWETEMPPINWEGDLYGKLFSCAELNCYLYKRKTDLELLSFTNEGHIFRQVIFSNCNPDIADLWQTSNADPNAIICGKNLAFYMDTLSPLINPPAKILEGYRANPYHLTDDPFYFGDYKIEHKGEFGFRCSKAEARNKIWEITLNGYLYRDLMFFPETNSVLICTAGHGGSVYSIDIDSGEKRFEIKTGGTRDIAVIGNKLYCYRLGKKGSLLEADIHTGVVLNEQQLYEVDLNSPLQKTSDSILITVSRKRINKVKQIPVLNGFEL